MLAADPFAAPKSGDGMPLVIDLWPGTAPDELADIGPERVRMSPQLDRKKVEVTESTRLITAVTKPKLTLYRPPADKQTGTTMLICPGGALGPVLAA